MQVITLTTDMGYGGYYVPRLKAALLSLIPESILVDISHSIPHYNVLNAAFIVKNTCFHFPAGTIHIITVNDSYRSNPQILALLSGGHYFIGADNGLFSLIFDKKPEKIVEINTNKFSDNAGSSLRYHYAHAAAHLAKGEAIESLGAEKKDYLQLTAWQPTYNSDSIKASIQYIDDYGNCFCNLTKELFEQVRKERKYRIELKRNYFVTGLVDFFSDVPAGEMAVFFSETGLLVLAINRGNMAQLLNIKETDSVHILFE